MFDDYVGIVMLCAHKMWILHRWLVLVNFYLLRRK